jgi:competence protein ComEA
MNYFCEIFFMNRIRKWIRNIFGFSGKEINGFLILLPLIVIALVSEPLYRAWIVSNEDDQSSDLLKLDSIVDHWKIEKPDSIFVIKQKPVNNFSKHQLFAFDPNKSSSEQLQLLGFSKFLSTRIVSYRQKGGQFRVKSDLRKIYGLDSTFYNHVYPYIQLPEKSEKQSSKVESPRSSRNTGTDLFDVNTADSVKLKSVYGIGPSLANRILKFRNALGGFNRIDQLKEVYGLDSIVVNQLKKVTFIEKNFDPVKININTASEKELASHPYIKKFIAKAIVAYRFQHGNFTEVEDIRKLTVVKADEADRIIPYIKVNN